MPDFISLCLFLGTLCFIVYEVAKISRVLLENRRFNRCIQYVQQLHAMDQHASAAYAMFWISWRFKRLHPVHLADALQIMRRMEQPIRVHEKGNPSAIIHELYQRAPILRMMEFDVLPPERSNV